MIIELFNQILFNPLFNLLVWLYNVLPGHDFGVAIIVLTLLIRLLLYPLAQKSIKSQKGLSDLQPQIKDIQRKYKNDKEKQAQELMKLYKEKGVNPAAGCLPILIQLPVLIALFQVLRRGLNPETLGALYGFVVNPGEINPLFFGFINLALPNFIFALLAGVSQFVQSKMILPKNQSQARGGSGFASALNKQMVYTMPVFTVLIAMRFPAGLALYWTVNNLFSIFQQYLIIRKKRDGQEQRDKKNN